VLRTAAAVVDIIIVNRWNEAAGIPDKVFRAASALEAKQAEAGGGLPTGHMPRVPCST